MKNKLLLSVLAATTILSASPVDFQIFKEMKLIEQQSGVKKIEAPAVKKVEKDYVQKVELSLKDRLMQSISLYNYKEFSAAKILLENTLVGYRDSKTLNVMKTFLKIQDKLQKEEEITSEINFLISLGQIDYFFINEIVRNLERTNRIEVGVYFLENIKADKTLIEELALSPEEVKKLGLSYYRDLYDVETNRQVSLGLFYEKVERLLEAYETLKENNKNNMQTAKINSIRERILQRIKLFSNKKQVVQNFQEEMKKTDQVKVYSIEKVLESK